MPAKLAPMLAESADAAFNRADWMWEPKLDGYRVLAFIDGEGVKLRSRRGLELRGDLPGARRGARRSRPRPAWCSTARSWRSTRMARPSFAALQDRAQLKTASEIAAADRDMPVVFFAFDLPCTSPASTCARRRTAIAGATSRNACCPRRACSSCTPSEDGVALNDAALASGFEGVIGKRKESRYESGKRSTSWLKVKPTRSADFVIGGYTQGKGSRATLGAILVGYWDEGKLRYASHVGSGFDDKTLAQVKARLEPLKRQDAARSPRCPSLNGAHDVGGAQGRRGGELPELDRRRRICGRRCSCGCATTSMRRR